MLDILHDIAVVSVPVGIVRPVAVFYAKCPDHLVTMMQDFSTQLDILSVRNHAPVCCSLRSKPPRAAEERRPRVQRSGTIKICTHVGIGKRSGALRTLCAASSARATRPQVCSPLASWLGKRRVCLRPCKLAALHGGPGCLTTETLGARLRLRQLACACACVWYLYGRLFALCVCRPPTRRPPQPLAQKLADTRRHAMRPPGSRAHTTCRRCGTACARRGPPYASLSAHVGAREQTLP